MALMFLAVSFIVGIAVSHALSRDAPDLSSGNWWGTSRWFPGGLRRHRFKALMRRLSRNVNVPGVPWHPVPIRNALHLVAVILCIRPGDADCKARALVIQGKGQRR